MIPNLPGSGNHLEDLRDDELEAKHEEDCECQDCCEERSARDEANAEFWAGHKDDR
jgi:hypothetical protein